MRVLERVADFINPDSDRINLHDLAERRLIFHRKTLQRVHFSSAFLFFFFDSVKIIYSEATISVTKFAGKTPRLPLHLPCNQSAPNEVGFTSLMTSPSLNCKSPFWSLL